MDLQIEPPESPKSPNSNNSKTSELSDWTTVSHEEFEISLPSIHKTRARHETNVTHMKHKPLIKQIAHKTACYVKTTLKELSYENITIVMQMIMKELDKSGIRNADKKHIAKLIIVYIMDLYSFNHVINYYTVEMIDALIEFIYHHGLHQYKKKQKKCLCF